MYIIISSVLILSILCFLIFHWKKKKIIKKLCCMSSCEKCHILNELVNPLGYEYDKEQDIFTSTPDAWQKKYGYGTIYDRLAPYFNMIFDNQPVYFNYGGKTWLIEFWKGQYGINTGSEIGIYHADSIISKSERKKTIFLSAQEDEYLEMTTELFFRNTSIAKLSRQHWWLTIFCMGRFSNPKSLTLDISIRFPNLEMRNAFIDGLLEAGYNMHSLYLCCNTVSFTFHSAVKEKVCLLKKAYICYVQFKNWIFCKLFCFITRPFTCTFDKLLYLYYYLPFVFRRMLRLKRFKFSHSKKIRKH